VKDGNMMKLMINGAKMEDAGMITVKSNADEASANLNVKREQTVFFKPDAGPLKTIFRNLLSPFKASKILKLLQELNDPAKVRVKLCVTMQLNFQGPAS
jgi:hypothetical protein